MPEYTLWTMLGMLAVFLLEILWWRTGIFRQPRYWISLAIILGFQTLVDGWLTKLSAPLVIYNPREFSGIRFPWDIPVEDFGFGWAMVTLVIMLWNRWGGTDQEQEGPRPGAPAPAAEPQPAAHPTDPEEPR